MPQPNNSNNNKKQIMGENVFLCNYLMILSLQRWKHMRLRIWEGWKTTFFEMEFAYSCGLTEYSTAWLESWILLSWMLGKEKGRSEDWGWRARWWVVVGGAPVGGGEWALRGQWASRCHVRQWRDKTSVGREGLEDGETGTTEDFCPGQFRKGALWWPGEGPGENTCWKMLRVSLRASDFGSQRQKWGQSFEGPSLPTLLMPFDGRGKIKSNVFQNQIWAFKCW